MPAKLTCPECRGDRLSRRAITPWLFFVTCLSCAHIWEATKGALEK